jgi:type I restriction enzyme S subunit
MRCATESGIFVAAGDPNTIPHLTAEKLRLYRFPFPPGDEQQAIVEYLDEDGQKSGLLISRVETAIDRLLEYRTALISAAVTGKIDVRGEM